MPAHLIVPTPSRTGSIRYAQSGGSTICLAELVTEGTASLVDITPFRPGRFAEGQPWHDASSYAVGGGVLTISR